MERNFLAGVLVIRNGRIVLERYGLGLEEGDRWSTMSTVKSMTAVLVGHRREVAAFVEAVRRTG